MASNEHIIANKFHKKNVQVRKEYSERLKQLQKPIPRESQTQTRQQYPLEGKKITCHMEAYLFSLWNWPSHFLSLYSSCNALSAAALVQDIPILLL